MELADRVLPDLLKAAKGGTEAARVLEKWDHLTEVDSRGAVLFQMFADRYLAGQGGVAAKLRGEVRCGESADYGAGPGRSCGSAQGTGRRRRRLRKNIRVA